MSNPSHTDCTVYLQVEPQFSRYDNERVMGAKVVAQTQKKPERPRPGTVVTKLTLRVPTAAFLPLRPEAIVVIPEDLVAADLPIEVEAGDPTA